MDISRFTADDPEMSSGFDPNLRLALLLLLQLYGHRNFKAHFREADALRHLGARHQLAGACAAAGRALMIEPHNKQVGRGCCTH